MSPNPNREQRALASLGNIRDKIIVFNGARAAAFNPNLTADEALESIRAYYQAYDADHPEVSA